MREIQSTKHPIQQKAAKGSTPKLVGVLFKKLDQHKILKTNPPKATTWSSYCVTVFFAILTWTRSQYMENKNAADTNLQSSASVRLIKGSYVSKAVSECEELFTVFPYLSETK